MTVGARGWGLGAGCAIAAVLLAACTIAKPLPDYGPVPEFQLTAQTGQPFDSKTLRGHVWVADFIYTSCPGPCPMMTSDMHKVQVSTAKTPDIKMVSFTVDPARDTPHALAVYSKNFDADPSRWYFLTGPEGRLNDLGLHAFHLNAVDGKFQHSTRFALVDQQGHIRGYYRTTEDGFMHRLLADVHRLERDKS